MIIFKRYTRKFSSLIKTFTIGALSPVQMYKRTVCIIITLYLTLVNCEPYRSFEGTEYDSRQAYDRSNRDRTWQNSGNYNYEEILSQALRRDYTPSRQEPFPRIISLLEEILARVKTQQSSYIQPIYIPYPILYPISIPVSSTEKDTRLPTINTRGFGVTDKTPDSNNTPDSNDDTRPITLDTIRPDRAHKRLSPPVEHGSEQFDMSKITQSSNNAEVSCSGAVVTCCSENTAQLRRNCLYKFGCNYNEEMTCRNDFVKVALDTLSTKYPS